MQYIQHPLIQHQLAIRCIQSQDITNPDKDVLSFPEPNPLYDSVSNALSIQLSGDSEIQ
jgi:hypothetical protein